jgi:ATP-dependent RNA helicase DDX56/DBP9
MMSIERSADDEAEIDSFEAMNLDERLLQAMSFLNWSHPTAVQASAIPLALQGKDLLVGATTGSGKTAIFLIPVIHQLLQSRKAQFKQTEKSRSAFCLVLTPTKELAFQTRDVVHQLCRYCAKEVTPMVIDPMEHEATTATMLASKSPDILIGTPSQILKLTEMHSSKVISKVKFFVIDEADVLFSFGYEKDLKKILKMTCKTFQAIVVSATLSKEIGIIQTLLPRNPTLVRLENEELPDETQLTQLKMDAADNTSKYLILLALLKFNILRGKSLIFCNTIKSAYKLKLFLHNFDVTAVVLNKDLPLNSRTHVVNQFNLNQYRIVIVTDDAVTSLDSKHGSKKKNPEYALSRGIDFQEVSVVVNFDFPRDSLVYIHRAGRTARGVKKGTVLSLVLPQEADAIDDCQKRLRDDEDEAPIQDFSIGMSEIEKLRYRANDVLSSITRKRVFDSMKQELADEVIKSKKLKDHFKSHPADLSAIKHDSSSKDGRKMRSKFTGIADIPCYLLPEDERKKQNKNEQRNSSTAPLPTHAHGSGKIRKKNPLKF